MNERYYAFNGDADGLCALQQLRLAEPGDARLVTGVKRDIELLRRVDAAPGDRVTVLDVSLDRNRADLSRLLAAGVHVRYFDHHHAGAIPEHPLLAAHVDEAPEVCTSIIVDRYLGGRRRAWAIVAAFGDGLHRVATERAVSAGFDATGAATLERLGTLLNYNSYGESIDDLHFTPDALAGRMMAYADPLEFARTSDVYADLDAHYEDDMRRARAVRPRSRTRGAIVLRLPDERWSRRVVGVLAHEHARSHHDEAVAILCPNRRGGYVVSVRTPAAGALGAADFCRRYQTGGGRRQAAGIDHLPRAGVDAFIAQFEASFAQ